MEGKALLFKRFGDVDAIPLCVRSKNVDDIVQVVSLLAGSFGVSTSKTSQHHAASKSRSVSKRSATSQSSTMTSTAQPSSHSPHSSTHSSLSARRSKRSRLSQVVQAQQVSPSSSSSSQSVSIQRMSSSQTDKVPSTKAAPA
ncbi:malate dehydrogenase (decarboxylating) (NAD+) protein [Trichomonas vaginalis G3]|uniref:malate dehydrogenase (decarboxylating) (NAD+) protein n=1 Tax=Trichomonas vaginalis (strain ATCC PRA-98 / G3) TaxID=412133 RepID=UPI0021E59425|nr:malate dehydrogenase (decarboxylating) (NAD+) protein [Trichomonas vaginalis G3]KAI5536243.1 malate dehydrogenase (decarboxylating) (NAD+) protein [Trichomonas vaginalis G3]